MKIETATAAETTTTTTATSNHFTVNHKYFIAF